MRRTHVWPYFTASFERAFCKVRFETNDARGKSYRYWAPESPGESWTPGTWRKPSGADALLYNLPAVIAHPDDETWWCEGERDADRAAAEGVLTTSHHGGAGKVSTEQVANLAHHSAVIHLVADVDAPGAVDVVRRYDLLSEWHPAERLNLLAPPLGYKDARDALDGGERLSRFRRLDLGRVRHAADRARADGCNGYGAPEPLSPEELAGLRGWKPKSA